MSDKKGEKERAKPKAKPVTKKQTTGIDSIKDTGLKTLLTNIQGDNFGVSIQAPDHINIMTKANTTMTYDKIIKPLQGFGYNIKNVENRWRTVHVSFRKEKVESA